MTLDEALSEAVCGARVRCDLMQPGSWVDYNFAGWRREWPSGTGCDFRASDEEAKAEWYEVVPCRDCGKHVQPQPDSMEGRCGCKPPTWGTPVKTVEVAATGVVSFEQAQRIGAAMKADAWGRPNKPEYVAAVDDLVAGKWGPPKAKDKWGKPI